MEIQKKIVPFEIKKEDIADEGVFTGYASTFGGKPDSYGDIIRQGAFKQTLKENGKDGRGIALLWQHNSDEPIGIWLELTENTKGLKAAGQLNLDVQKGKEAYSLLKMGAINGLSIGFDIARDDKGDRIEDAVEWDDKKDIRYLNQLDLWEASIVTFAANPRANITNVKDAIKNAKDERELEYALRDECGLTNSAAKYIAGLCKDKMFSRGKYFTDEELAEFVSLKVNEALFEMSLRELKSFNERAKNK